MQTILTAASLALILAALAHAPARADEPAEARRDVHSHGNPEQVRVEHIDLDLAVDFDARVLSGRATLSLRRAADGTPLVLDSRDLTIESVAASKGEQPLAGATFELGLADKIMGAPLTIRLPAEADRVTIAYRTSPKASALQWVAPEGTAGGKRPFLFTQSEAIHARSWIPCQDSPAVRVTYAARVRMPEGYTAVMSADLRGRDGATFHFDMPEAIPPYLIALAVGDLAFRETGPRTGVWAEPSVVEKAASEFADAGTMVDAAEKRFGKYRWGRYDILVLPPSFPFGGMENAKLTFATPTVLAGDRSLVALVAHELAHSWSGNLVTNATWRDFWLNEGFTTYIERRIVEDLYGADRAAMERALGRVDLDDALAQFADKQRLQVLHVDLAGRDPDEGMNQIPYEKGALFLLRLEQAFGRDKFDPFLRDYFDHFAFRSITTADFEAYLKEKLFAQNPDVARTIDLHAWLHEPGLPPDAPKPKAARFDAIDRQAKRFADGDVKAVDLDAASWSTHEWLRFLQALPADLKADRLAELDGAYHLTNSGNSEILAQWLQMAIRAGYAAADARLEQFLTTVGRRKYLMPLYKELARTPAGKERARAIYRRARPMYHPIAVNSVDELLGAPAP